MGVGDDFEASADILQLGIHAHLLVSIAPIGGFLLSGIYEVAVSLVSPVALFFTVSAMFEDASISHFPVTRNY